MAVLKSWYVIIFFIIGVRSSNDKEEIENHLEKIESLKYLATGYNNQEQYERENLENNSGSDLLSKISDLYVHLECGYFYSTQFHLKLTGEAVFDNIKNILTQETIEYFLFDKEASMMLDSLLDLKKYSANRLWLLVIYARQLSVFFGQIIKDGGTFNSEILTETQRMHEFVLTEIDKHFENLKCPIGNSFDIKNKKPYSVSNIDSVKNAIQQNKKLLHENFEKNRDKGLLQFSMSESFWDGLFIFHDKETYRLVIDEFLADNSDRITVFRKTPYPIIICGLKGIKTLWNRQRLVIGTLKTIMLEIMLSYTIQSSRMDQSNDFVTNTNKFVNEIISKFMDLMLLNDKKSFKKVYEKFTNCSSYTQRSHSFKECMKVAKVAIEWLIGELKKKVHLPLIKTILSDCEGGNVIEKPTVSDFLRVGKLFLEKIENNIIPHSIRLVYSFGDFRNTIKEQLQ
ncbi:uncharacterized protein LOC126846222 [Adelges cooleyi]|uniref:uncharacterized protein LOC126846222 n=1 Tax=Adelges cooleyi TaxID=133065 RepID=UPI00217F4D0A|nr:uncharacterized protein LOC126846222 [Adelges cooleyi]